MKCQCNRVLSDAIIDKRKKEKSDKKVREKANAKANAKAKARG